MAFGPGKEATLTAEDARLVEDAFRSKLAVPQAADVCGQPSPVVAAASEPAALPQALQPALQGRNALSPSPIPSARIDKSLLAIPLPWRLRDKSHLRFVAQQPCLVCGRQPCDAHHLRFAQSRGLGLKVSDEFTVPLCRAHHRELHQSGKEVDWWARTGIEPIDIALKLWTETRPLHSDVDGMAPGAAVTVKHNKAPAIPSRGRRMHAAKRTQLPDLPT
jgi:hypothetical protein